MWGRARSYLETLQEAATKALQSRETYVQARVQSSLATQSMAMGQFEKSAAILEEAISCYQDLGEPLHEMYSNLLLATIYLRLNALSTMTARLERALEIAEGNNLMEAPTILKLLKLVGKKEETDEWSRSFVRALSDLLRRPELQTVISPSNKAQVAALGGLLERQPMENIEAKISSALEDVQDTEDRKSQATLSRLLGTLYLKQGKPEKALTEWQDALATTQLFGNKGDEAAILSGISKLHWKAGRIENALQTGAHAVSTVEASLEDVALDELAIQAQANADSIYGSMIEMLLRIKEVEAAFLYSERARNRALLRLLASAQLRSGDGEGGERIRQAKRIRSELRDLERRIESQEPSEDLLMVRKNTWQRFEDALLRIRLNSRQDYASLVDVDTLTLAEIRQRALQENCTLISFYATGERLVAWVLDRHSIHFIPLPVDGHELPRLVSSTRSTREMASRGVRPAEFQNPAGKPLQQLYKGLVAPLLPLIEHRNLILIPYGLLHSVPFAALQSPQTGRYLVEDFTVTYAPSANALAWMRDKITPTKGEALVLGGPNVSDPSLPFLPGSRDEAVRIATQLLTKPLLGREASEDEIYAQGADVDILHVSAHGIFNKDHPLFSYLALTPTGEEDGRLEMGEVFARLHLQEVNLVVLSACQSALGDPSGGDEVVGLTRAFLHAGAPAVLATLWRIDDAASVLLMEDFYGSLLQGIPAAESLRRAQLSMMGRTAYRDPFFWAAFKLTGDPGMSSWHSETIDDSKSVE